MADFNGTVDFTGTGTLSFTFVPKPKGTVGVSGVGTLSHTFVPKPKQTRTYTGAGTVTNAGSPGVAFPVTLSGSGTESNAMTGMGVLVDFPLEGEGLLTKSALLDVERTVVLFGAGQLEGEEYTRNLTLTYTEPAAVWTGIDPAPDALTGTDPEVPLTGAVPEQLWSGAAPEL